MHCKNSDRNQQMSSHALAAFKPAGVGLPDRERAGTLTLFRLISTCLTAVRTAAVIATCIIFLHCVQTVAGPHFKEENIQGGNSRRWYSSPHRLGVRIPSPCYPFFFTCQTTLVASRLTKQCYSSVFCEVSSRVVKTYLVDHKDCICIA